MEDEEAVDLAAEMFGDGPPDAPSSEHPLLTNAELAEIREEARAKIAKEQHAKARKEALERAMSEARAEAGNPDIRMTDMVTIHLDLPEFCSDIRLDGKIYFHNRTYPVQRHVADSLREQMFRAWMHQRDIDGKSLVQFYERSKSMGGVRSLNRGGSISMKAAAA